LLNSTLTAALHFTVAQTVPAGIVSTQAVIFANGALKTLAVTKWTFALAALVVFLGIGGGASLLAFRAGGGDPGGSLVRQAGAARGKREPKPPQVNGGTVVAVADRPRRVPKDAGKAGLAESMAVRAGGVDFQAVVQRHMTAPAPGAVIPVNLGLRITNPGKKPLLFSLEGSFRYILRTPDGKIFSGMSLGSYRPRRTPPVQVDPGKATTISLAAWLRGSRDGKSLRLRINGKDSNGWGFFDLQPGKYLVIFRYANANQQDGGRPLWVGKVTTPPAKFEFVARKRQAAAKLSLNKLIADLSSDNGGKRVTATKEVFRRGKGVLNDLKAAGAKQVAPIGGTINTRRLDMVYSLLKGLPPNLPQARAGYRTDSFGLYVEPGTTKYDLIQWGKKAGFFPGRRFPQRKPAELLCDPRQRQKPPRSFASSLYQRTKGHQRQSQLL
jgi:hypothetical protein